MKVILEPNEILIRILPSKKAPSGYYYTVQTKSLFRVYDDLPRVFDEIEKLLIIRAKEVNV